MARAAEILQIEPLLQRKPAALSGGQRQRVAIGRALVRDVDVFLFDEPLSNLDAKLRSELRVEIKRLHQRLDNTMIYVTHDQIEAMTLADRIAVMKGGVIQQLDTPQAIYNRPVNLFVAGFIGSPGMNFLEGDHQRCNRLRRSGSNGSSVPLDALQLRQAVARRPAARAWGPAGAHRLWRRSLQSSHSANEVEVEIVEPMGSDTLVWAKLGGQNFAFRVDAERTLTVGERIADRLRPGARLDLRRRSGQPDLNR